MQSEDNTAMDTLLRTKTGKGQGTLETSRFPHLLAAIDMGSNSFRLEIAELSKGRYKRVDYLKEIGRAHV